jgi:hypothetical protein
VQFQATAGCDQQHDGVAVREPAQVRPCSSSSSRA